MSCVGRRDVAAIESRQVRPLFDTALRSLHAARQKYGTGAASRHFRVSVGAPERPRSRSEAANVPHASNSSVPLWADPGIITPGDVIGGGH